jgi:membrane protease YdiL (CAAX protease family)
MSTVVMLLLFAGERVARWLAIDGWRLSGEPLDAWLRTIWLSVLVNLLAAVGEELIYRGYLLTGLSRAWGQRAGLAAMALLFALPHLLVAGAGETHWVQFVLALALPGLMLGWAYQRARSLWLPVGLHFAWNLLQDDVLNLSGKSSGESLFGLLTRQRGPVWIVGTSYGIEVGLAGVSAVALALAGVWLWTRQRHRCLLDAGKWRLSTRNVCTDKTEVSAHQGQPIRSEME